MSKKRTALPGREHQLSFTGSCTFLCAAASGIQNTSWGGAAQWPMWVPWDQNTCEPTYRTLCCEE